MASRPFEQQDEPSTWARKTTEAELHAEVEAFFDHPPEHASATDQAPANAFKTPRQERSRRAVDRTALQPPVDSDAPTKKWKAPEISARKPTNAAAARQNPTHPIKLPNDLHKRVHDCRHGLRHYASMPSMGIAKQSKINDCIQRLKNMGFAKEYENEASRLSMYASATGGDIFEAVEMVEEARKAGDSLKGKGRRQTMGQEYGPGGWL